MEGLDVFTATAIACFSSSLRRSPAAAISASLTCSAATVVLSNFALYSRSAASPLALTLFRISVTVLLMLSEAEIAGRVKSCCCWSALQPFQSMIVLKLMIVFPCVSRDRLADYSIIFSIGSTRMELAPSAFSFPWSPRTGFRC
nr:Uncharacterised protein [Klebsiella pneumoniae]